MQGACAAGEELLGVQRQLTAVDSSAPFLLEALIGQLFPAERCLSAEKACKATLRRAGDRLDAIGRAKFARRFFGVLQLRRKLSAIISAAQQFDDAPTDHLVSVCLLVTVYVCHFEEVVFPHIVASEGASRVDEWILALTRNKDLPPALLDLLDTVPALDCNQVLRGLNGDTASLLADRHSLPDWLAAELIKENPQTADECAAAFNLPAPVTLRCNTFKCNLASLAAELAHSDGVITHQCALSPTGLHITSPPKPPIWSSELWKRGWYEVQDEASQLVALACAVRPGDVCLDLCCGRGGKALHLAALMLPDTERGAPSEEEPIACESPEPAGVLVCHDIEPDVLRAAMSRLQRSGEIVKYSGGH